MQKGQSKSRPILQIVWSTIGDLGEIDLWAFPQPLSACMAIVATIPPAAAEELRKNLNKRVEGKEKTK